MTQQVAIEVNQLLAQYGETVILKNINLRVYEGEIFIILGGSGCGKSTLLKHIVGLNRPASGDVYIDGVNITLCDGAQFHLTLRKIGVLFQNSALFGAMTVADNVALPIREYSGLPPGDVESMIRRKLEMVNLGGYEGLMPSELSGGMRKRAGLARALALNPKILFLDEPSAGLDPVTSAEIDELILDINRTLGTTIVIVTHELESIYNLAHRVIMLDKVAKGIIAEGHPIDLKNNSQNKTVQQFFNRLAHQP